jgi:hypothetical protein
MTKAPFTTSRGLQIYIFKNCAELCHHACLGVHTFLQQMINYHTTIFDISASTKLVFLRSVRRLLVTASIVPSSPILVTLMKEALSSSETSVVTRATRRNTPEDTIIHSYRCENLKSYIETNSYLTGDTLYLHYSVQPVNAMQDLGIS